MCYYLDLPASAQQSVILKSTYRHTARTLQTVHICGLDLYA